MEGQTQKNFQLKNKFSRNYNLDFKKMLFVNKMQNSVKGIDLIGLGVLL